MHRAEAMIYSETQNFLVPSKNSNPEAREEVLKKNLAIVLKAVQA
jgi:hypothetical protein